MKPGGSHLKNISQQIIIKIFFANMYNLKGLYM